MNSTNQLMQLCHWKIKMPKNRICVQLTLSNRLYHVGERCLLQLAGCSRLSYAQIVQSLGIDAAPNVSPYWISSNWSIIVAGDA